jgi:3-hydroxy-9,10-secoandrosta-1,3,5(10)-triene-9,17-dione monooxygenase
MMTLLPFTLASPVLGMAQGALDAFAEQVHARRTPTGGTMADSVAYQLRLAESSAEVDSARLLMRHDCHEILDRAARGEIAAPLDRARYRRDHAYMTRLCVRAIDRLFEAAGGHALYDDNPLQRFYRDAHAASHHTALVWDAPAEVYGRVALGLELPPGMRL